MAKSKYEYVKSFEVEDQVMPPNIIVVRLDGYNYRRFSEEHGFERPNDLKALELMNACATSVLEEYPDIVFSYGFSDEYSFVFKKTTKFYQRRASKILSLIVSLFTSMYVTRWKEFFPQKELGFPPPFHGRVISCACVEVLQQFLAWRQYDCHVNNLYNTCFWMLVKSGKTDDEACELLKDTQKQDKNELLYQQFDINYKKLPVIFRQGSCVLKTEVEDIVKYNETNMPVKRLRKRPITVHSEDIAGRTFWSEQRSLLLELGGVAEDVGKIKPDYVRSFLFERKLMPSTWIVIRIDGCHFHRFSEVHEFKKPNDEQALNLMNACAVAVLQEFQDVVFSYGVSDEYSFVFKKVTMLYQRRASDIVSAIVSFFSSMYVMNWRAFFPERELKYPPSFDGRAVCYPSRKILRDYLAWRQVDCHINNQYNTCFWALVKSGKQKSQAQHALKGTQSQDKYDLLGQFGIEYSALKAMFRLGSSIFREPTGIYDNGATAETLENKVIIEHCDIIEQGFWKAHPRILDQKH